MKTLALLWEKIDAIPKNPRNIREPYGTVLFALPDMLAFISQSICRHVPFLPSFSPFRYRYHAYFKRRIFEVPNRIRIDSVVGEKPASEILVVLVHGIFQSKNFKFIRDMAQRLYERYSVAVVDIRDHLGTFRLASEYPASGGTIEGRDILEIAGQLKKRKPGLRIFLIGFSYGGGIVLNAMDEGRARGIISGVIAISPTMSINHAVAHIDTDPGIASPFYPMYSLFRICLRLRYGISIRTFHEYIEKAAQQYGYGTEEIMKRSSVAEFERRIEIPTLLIIAKDDAVIPKGDIAKIVELSRENEYVHVCVREHGGHIAFSFIDQDWFYGIIREFTDSKWSDA